MAISGLESKIAAIQARLREVLGSKVGEVESIGEIDKLLSASWNNLDAAPHLACTNNGTILEQVLKVELGGNFLLQKVTLEVLISELRSARSQRSLPPIPARIGRKIGEIQKLRNQGAHSTVDPCSKSDAEESLAALVEVLEWFYPEKKSLGNTRTGGFKIGYTPVLVSLVVVIVVAVALAKIYWPEPAPPLSELTISIGGGAVTVVITGDVASFDGAIDDLVDEFYTRFNAVEKIHNFSPNLDLKPRDGTFPYKSDDLNVTMTGYFFILKERDPKWLKQELRDRFSDATSAGGARRP